MKFQGVVDALRFLANNPRPQGGEDKYNSAHLLQLAEGLENYNEDIALQNVQNVCRSYEKDLAEVEELVKPWLLTDKMEIIEGVRNLREEMNLMDEQHAKLSEAYIGLQNQLKRFKMHGMPVAKGALIKEALEDFISDFEMDFMLDGRIVDTPDERWGCLTRLYYKAKQALELESLRS